MSCLRQNILMNLREELNIHAEKTWVLCIPEDSGENTKYLSPLTDLVDWYNNQILTKMILSKKITLKMGEQTLISTIGLLPAEKLLVMGLGEKKLLSSSQALKFIQVLSHTLESLNETNVWIIFSSQVPGKFLDEIKKSHASSDSLAHTTISVG